VDKIETALRGVHVAVPESRQLDTMVQLLERRGARVRQVPLVAIHNAPDPKPVLDWISAFIDSPPDMFIALTGEGIRRLLSLADRNRIREEFRQALKSTMLLCRGPKPQRVLRQEGLKADIQASAPTTAGIIATLGEMNIQGQRIGVQLYGDDPNLTLMNYLESRHASIETVAPYVYADELEESRVVDLVDSIISGMIDVVAFTSKPQVRRLMQVATRHNRREELLAAMQNCCVAAVGPVVREHLEENGIEVKIMPPKAFFMKPLVTEIMRYFRSVDDTA